MEVVNVSIVVPVSGDGRSLAALAARVEALRAGWDRPECPLRLLEAVLVDDGAPDAARPVLDGLAARLPWVRVVSLSRRFGRHRATAAGMLHSSGDWIVTAEEDLALDPARIPDLLRAAVARRADVVYARPAGDAGGGVLAAAAALLAGNRVLGDATDLRLVRGPLGRAAAGACGHEAHLDVALSWFADRFAALPPFPEAGPGAAGGPPRGEGLADARRAVLASRVPLRRLAAVFGVAALVTAFACDWPPAVATTLFVGGVLGLLGAVQLEVLATVALHAHGKPAFFVVDRSPDGAIGEYLDRTAARAAPP